MLFLQCLEFHQTEPAPAARDLKLQYKHFRPELERTAKTSISSNHRGCTWKWLPHFCSFALINLVSSAHTHTRTHTDRCWRGQFGSSVVRKPLNTSEHTQAPNTDGVSCLQIGCSHMTRSLWSLVQLSRLWQIMCPNTDAAASSICTCRKPPHLWSSALELVIVWWDDGSSSYWESSY